MVSFKFQQFFTRFALKGMVKEGGGIEIDQKAYICISPQKQEIVNPVWLDHL